VLDRTLLNWTPAKRAALVHNSDDPLRCHTQLPNRGRSRPKSASPATVGITSRFCSAAISGHIMGRPGDVLYTLPSRGQILRVDVTSSIAGTFTLEAW
jgi:hypothetical protein